MTHILRPGQNIFVLLEDSKMGDLETRLNSSDRTIRDTLNLRITRPNQSKEDQAAKEVYKRKSLPWSEAVEDALYSHRRYERQEKWTDLEQNFQFCVEPPPNGLKPSETPLGYTIVAYSYLSRLYFAPMRAATLSPEQLETFDAVAERLLAFLEPLKKELWAWLLCFNVKANQLGLLWESTPGKERVQLKDAFVKAQFYNEMIAYLDRYQRDREVAHNVLCYASRLGLTAHFPELRERMRVACGGVEPNYDDTDEFDSDFDNFRAWLRDEEKQEANLAVSVGLNEGSKPSSPLPIGFGLQQD